MTPLRTTPARLAAGAIALALAVLAAPTPARADLFLEVLNASAPAGGTGSFDVVLLSNGGSFDVGGFSVELSVASGSGVTFTGATTSTADPYVFGTYQSDPSPFATDPANPGSPATFPNTHFCRRVTPTFAPPFTATVTPAQLLGSGPRLLRTVATGTADGPGDGLPAPRRHLGHRPRRRGPLHPRQRHDQRHRRPRAHVPGPPGALDMASPASSPALKRRRPARRLSKPARAPAFGDTSSGRPGRSISASKCRILQNHLQILIKFTAIPFLPTNTASLEAAMCSAYYSERSRLTSGPRRPLTG